MKMHNPPLIHIEPLQQRLANKFLHWAKSEMFSDSYLQILDRWDSIAILSSFILAIHM